MKKHKKRAIKGSPWLWCKTIAKTRQIKIDESYYFVSRKSEDLKMSEQEKETGKRKKCNTRFRRDSNKRPNGQIQEAK